MPVLRTGIFFCACEAPQPTQGQITNQNSANFARDSLPVFLPSWSMPAYMAITKPAQNPPQQ
jgi:hypothetical protein